ncbi:hypothetical protein [Dyadobacter sp. OTU695]|uniref:hypothetical protein n=1 Tax=Dyadobacter sp. OTU695 TaxID=3043860 RepID=UPI00313D3820
MEELTFKEEALARKNGLIARFVTAREKLGRQWRKRLAESDPLFNTNVGYDMMVNASGALSDPTRIGIDRLNSVVVAMEKIINEQPAEV